MGTFLDVDAPDTNWRAGNEDPIPFLLGRVPAGGFLYRFATGRPLDGHMRTNATFLHAGTKPLTKSGHTAPYNYWPGWKRGLLMTRLPAFGLLPFSALIEMNELTGLSDAWWLQHRDHLVWLPLAAYSGTKTAGYLRGRKHSRDYLQPIEKAAITVLRSRDRVKADIPRGLVGAKDITARGSLFVPPGWAGQDGDREQLLTIVRDRLGAQELDANWNLEGRAPHMEMYVPAQPPKLIGWDRMMEAADTISPYLGDSAGGAVHWKLGLDSPHMGIIGDSGCGKSELMAWIVAQFMRGGAGVVVLDPKYSSHKWLMGRAGVMYCSEAQQNHDTILWLDEELRRRGRASQTTDDEFPRLVVLLEERNSLQSMLRELWTDIKPTGAGASPALAALNRLASQGRSLGITVLLAGQESAQQAIGSRASYGSFAIAGRMGANHWRNVMGTGSRKPAIKAVPGRFGYVVGGQAQVFQAAYPDLKGHRDRLIGWALGGTTPLDVQAMMMMTDTAPFPRSEPSSSVITDPFISLREFATRNGEAVTWFNNQRQRHPGAFPEPKTRRGTTDYYSETELATYYSNKKEA